MQDRGKDKHTADKQQCSHAGEVKRKKESQSNGQEDKEMETWMDDGSSQQKLQNDHVPAGRR